MEASSGPEGRGVARIRREVARLLGTEVTAYQFTPGGWSVSVRGVLTLAGGQTVFAKLGDVPDTAHALRDEIAVYRSLGRRPFLPRLVAEDHDVPLLVIEDLSGATRVPPWTAATLNDYRRLCAELGSTPAPASLIRLETETEGDAWERVAADPIPASRVLPATWLERNLPALLAAQRQARAAGSSLVHTDLRSDNLLFLPDRPMAVDWNLVRRGDARWDRHLTAHTIAMEGGGTVDELLPDADPAIVAWLAGFFASRAGLPPPEGAPRVRGFQRAQLDVVLPWACRLLGLAAPPAG
jgi:hypothetical protein